MAISVSRSIPSASGFGRAFGFGVGHNTVVVPFSLYVGSEWKGGYVKRTVWFRDTDSLLTLTTPVAHAMLQMRIYAHTHAFVRVSIAHRPKAGATWRLAETDFLQTRLCPFLHSFYLVPVL